jgi:predicted metalloprotease
MDERDRERHDPDAVPPRVERETTVIHTGGRGGGGGTGLIVAIVLLMILAAVLFFVFGGGLERTADQTDVNVNIETPEIKLPDIDVDLPERPSEPAEPAGNGQ